MARTIEQILREVKSLPPAEQSQLVVLLETQMRSSERHKTVDQLVAEQGTKPLCFEELLGEPDTTEDENIDEFLALLAELRGQPSSRRVG